MFCGTKWRGERGGGDCHRVSVVHVKLNLEAVGNREVALYMLRGGSRVCKLMAVV